MESLYSQTREQRAKALLNEFIANGFTEQQARYLINLLDNFIPLV